jgi:transposase
MSFSIDLRKRVMAAIDGGMRITQAAKVFQVSRSAIYDWQKLLKKSNNLGPVTGYQKGHSHKITNWEEFRIFVQRHQHCASPQMRAEWKKLTNIDMSESVMLRALKKIGYTSKKKLLIMPRQTKKSVQHFWKKSKI